MERKREGGRFARLTEEERASGLTRPPVRPVRQRKAAATLLKDYRDQVDLEVAKELISAVKTLGDKAREGSLEHLRELVKLGFAKTGEVEAVKPAKAKPHGKAYMRQLLAELHKPPLKEMSGE